jgi:hypothetical protein
MSKLIERATLLFRRPRPVSKEEVDRIANWVNKGGAVDPEGPPPIVSDQDEIEER